MVVRRRGTVMGLVAIGALLLAVAYLARFSADRGLVSFLLGGALLLVALVHAVAWSGSRKALLVVDLSGVQVRLAGRWVTMPWSEVERVDVAGRRRLGDGRLSVHPRDERRALPTGVRPRFALLLNRWLYDAPLVVPYGLTTKVSVTDIPGTLRRLADGRAEVVVLDDQAVEPEPTVEVAPAGTHLGREAAEHDPEPEGVDSAPVAHPGRLAAVVTALRSQPTRRDGATVGTLALSAPQQGSDPLPELAELRRKAPEEQSGESTDDAAHVVLVGQPVDTVPTPEAPAPDVPSTVHIDIAARVRDAREWLGMSVDELADRTRIRPSVIEAIEDGDFTPCGGDVYARGHLRMLAGALGIDAAPLLATYDEHVATAPVSPRAVFDAGLSRGIVRPAGHGSRWGALVATVIVLVVAWVVAKVLLPGDTESNGESPTAPSHHASRQVDRPAIDDPAIGDQIPPPAPPLHLTLSASGGSSRVVVRDSAMKVIYEGLLADGQSAGVSGEPPLRVMASNAGVVSLTAPGHPTAVMGPVGRQVYRHVG